MRGFRKDLRGLERRTRERFLEFKNTESTYIRTGRKTEKRLSRVLRIHKEELLISLRGHT